MRSEKVSGCIVWSEMKDEKNMLLTLKLLVIFPVVSLIISGLCVLIEKQIN